VAKEGTARQTTDDNIICRMRSACWITKATDIHSEYVILIPFQLQQWFTRTRLYVTLYVHCIRCKQEIAFALRKQNTSYDVITILFVRRFATRYISTALC
jgi:hypothetical protein